MMKIASLKQVNELETKYNVVKKDNEISLLNKEKQIQETELEKRRAWVIFFISIAAFFIFIAFMVIRNNVKRKRANILLLKLNREILSQKKETEFQKAIVEEKNKDILDSIHYAKRLQDAILPTVKQIKEKLPESFILYKPKDVVAGDFYWMESVNDLTLFAAADCTGHGVPGALVSVVCSNALNRTVKEFHITDTGKILDKVTQLILETFEKSESEVKDGMDISLCCLNRKTNQLNWSGANNPLWFFSNGEMKEIAPNKQTVGKNENYTPFQSHSVTLNKGDSVYLFTDGFADQFGGPKGKKFMYKQLKELFQLNATRKMDEQQKALNLAFENWKGGNEQVDDLLVFGIRI